MMTTVQIHGMDTVAKFDEDKTFSVTLNNGDTYEECAISTAHHLIAFDPAICEWVQLM